MREGEGKEETSHGVYQGSWKDDMKNGHGRLDYKNGDYYEGNWENNEFSGEGEYYQKDNCTYNGEFRFGRYEGQGVMKYTNDDQY